ncbi:hypothetical protein BO79DRAFT_274117 [Aspergillus costaricaensis CBS 115574]|uniref:Uncharacterized protein n=1 Tax=Aspergillus costaricaensis CBS 115574 TaxID=1448317 RepID=A0ACD1I471_9EURO|nr:hypothetical protein BO79DRAFT_274117 [Aspergillus costaricaensis CBS 115574]RAK85016.1 hypothetical protein BO79DRAFT_274117 [Aspergillus costaricaensis CBS 115574]
MPSGSDSSGSAKPMASQWAFPARLPLISCKSLVTSPTATSTIVLQPYGGEFRSPESSFLYAKFRLVDNWHVVFPPSLARR